MIVEAILNAVKSLLFSVFSFLHIPQLPDQLLVYVSDFLDLLDYAKGFIAFFIPPSLFNFVLNVFTALFLIDHGYPLIMWIIHKLPFSID